LWGLDCDGWAIWLLSRTYRKFFCFTEELEPESRLGELWKEVSYLY
jgi:hypothetical protein